MRVMEKLHNFPINSPDLTTDTTLYSGPDEPPLDCHIQQQSAAYAVPATIPLTLIPTKGSI